ncbi:MAG: DUF2202 domain-containing protein [Marinilabiliales bacterium]|nr:DUF2202 domain-containing protein [Marinilabiliales bacterium]
MKTLQSHMMLGSTMLFLGLMFGACSKNDTEPAMEQFGTILEVGTDGTSTIAEQTLKSAFVATAALNATEQTDLLKMQQEEKLARDVYAFLAEKFGNGVFSRISEAENRHMNAILLLLSNEGIVKADAARGLFDTKEFTDLYQSLTTKGAAGLNEANGVGALIEELDIRDLTVASGNTVNQNILMVFENLTRGSRNHLRAFNRQLTAAGLSYQPIYLTSSAFQEIVSGNMENGRQYRINTGQGSCKR